MTDLIGTKLEDGVGIVTLNAPERRNAISPEMRSALLEALRSLVRSNECRVIILNGAGGHFCSGGDMRNKEIDKGPDSLRTYTNALPLQDIVRIIATGPKPVIAAVEGAASGAGFALAAACDHVIAAHSAKFSASFSKVGLLPDAGILWSLPRRVGAVKANKILLTAAVVDAAKALDLGLADELAPDGKALELAIERAIEFSSVAPLPLAAIRSIGSRASTDLESVLAAEREMQPLLALSSDYAEGRAAFIARRPARYTGR